MRKTLFLPICLLILTGAVATSGLPAWPNIDNPAPEGPTAAARLGASVARLKDGRLLISGGAGDNGVPVRTAEIFKDGSTSQAASMFNPRTRHASVPETPAVDQSSTPVRLETTSPLRKRSVPWVPTENPPLA